MAVGVNLASKALAVDYGKGKISGLGFDDYKVYNLIEVLLPWMGNIVVVMPDWMLHQIVLILDWPGNAFHVQKHVRIQAENVGLHENVFIVSTVLDISKRRNEVLWDKNIRRDGK